MHYFSNLFDKVLYMFWTGPLSIIKSVSKLYKCNSHASSVVCLLADRQRNYYDKYLLHVCSVEILLLMDSGPVRNM